MQNIVILCFIDFIRMNIFEIFQELPEKIFKCRLIKWQFIP